MYLAKFSAHKQFSFSMPLGITFFFLIESLSMNIGYSMAQANSSPVLPPWIVQDTSGIEKDPSCFPGRSILKLRYANGIRAYLVSDPSLGAVYLAAAVGHGSFDDPNEHLGIAHLLEHCVFQGSEHYPEPGGLLAFCTANGGQRNGITYGDRSIYALQINSSALQEAALRFADMLQSPILSSQTIISEREVVDEEFRRNTDMDDWRQRQLTMQMGAEMSPFGRFDIGNRDSLKDVDSPTLKAWHQANFTTDRMVVVAMGAAPLDVLQSAVTESFGNLKESTSKPPRLCRTSFSDSGRHRILHFPSVEERRTLTCTWELDCGHSQDLDHQSGQLLCSCLLQGCSNGLIAGLSEKGWITDFDAAAERIAKAKVHINITLELTPSGSQHYHEILKELHQCLNTIKVFGIPKALQKQFINAPILFYRFSTPKDPFEECLDMAFNLCDEPLESYPRKTLSPMRYQPSYLVEVLEQMSSAFGVVTLSWPKEELPFVTDQKEPWMQIPWAAEKLSPDQVDDLEQTPADERFCPCINPLIPDSLQSIEGSLQREWKWPSPIVLEQSDRAQAWLLKDSHFGLPESHYELQIRSPLMDGSPSSVVCADMISLMVERRLLSLRKQADAAKTSLELRNAPLFWSLRVSGPHITGDEGLGILLRTLRSLSWSVQEWEAAQTLCIQRYEAENAQLPHQLATRNLTAVLEQPDPLPMQKLKVIASLTDQSLSNWWYQVFDRVYWELLGYGALTSGDMQALCQRIHGIMRANPWPVQHHFKPNLYENFGEASSPLHHTISSRSGSGVSIALAKTFENIRERAALRIIRPWFDTEFFEMMRSERQAAYSASAQLKDFYGKMGALIFETLSHQFSSDRLVVWTDEFLTQLHQNLADRFTPAVFAELRQAAESLWSRPPPSMEGVFEWCSRCAFKEAGHFDLAEQFVEAIRSMTYEQCLEIVEQWLAPSVSKRIEVQVSPAHTEVEDQDQGESMSSFHEGN